VTDDLVKRLRGTFFSVDPFDAMIFQEAADRIEQLEAALRFAAGMISTMPPFDMDHPEETLEWIMKESAALGEKKDG
jgi:hypothetical protein